MIALGTLLLFCLMLLVARWHTNPFTPSGSVGYVFEEPRMFGSGGFRGVVEGPGSYGSSLMRNRVINIDLRARSLMERVQVPLGTGGIQVRCDAVVRLAGGDSVKAVVERFGGTLWHRATVRPLLREVAQEVLVGNIDEMKITMSPVALSRAVEHAMRDRLKADGVPVLVDRVLVSDVVGPPGFRFEPADIVITDSEESGDSEPPIEVNVAQTPPERSDQIQLTHQREFRAMWVATTSNIDWPSKIAMPVAKQKAELIAALDLLQELNMNVMMLQVRGSCDALYASPYEPWSVWLTGTQGQEPDPAYDPLAFAIEECRKRSIELHAWINPYRAKTPEDYALADNHIAKVHPQYAYKYGSQLWMDPGAKPVQDWIIRIVKDIAERYDIDGLHMDDYFYPYPLAGETFPDDATYEEHVKCCGYLERSEWRRQNVNTLVSRVAKVLRETKPHLKFGVSPFGLYRPGEPEGVKGLDQYSQIFSDPKRWLDNGWVDYITPQLYWRHSSDRGYGKLLDWWTSNNPLRRHIYAGNNLKNVSARYEDWPFSEMEKQVSTSRKSIDRQSLGNVFLGLSMLRGDGKNAKRYINGFKKNMYPDPALPPLVPWLADAVPPCPTGLRFDGEVIRWDTPAYQEAVRSWSLYQRQEDLSWELKRVLSGATTEIHAIAGTYAVCAVSPLAQESTGVVVTVPPGPRQDEWPFVDPRLAQVDPDEVMEPKDEAALAN